jgi:hypothetical protein
MNSHCLRPHGTHFLNRHGLSRLMTLVGVLAAAVAMAGPAYAVSSAPVADPGGPYTAHPSSTITLNGNGSWSCPGFVDTELLRS